MSKKIIHILTDGHPSGGVSFLASLLAQQQNDQNITSYVICERHSYAYELFFQYAKLVFPIQFYNKKVDFVAVRAVRKVLMQMQPDVVHVHGRRAAFFIYLAVRKMSKLSRPKLIYTIHGFQFLRRGCCSFVSGWVLEKLLVNYFDLVTYVADSDQQIAQRWRLKPRRGEVIYNGIIPLKKSLQSKNKVVGFLGRLEKPKNVFFLVKVMRLLVDEGYTLLIVGGGRDEAPFLERVAQVGLSDCVTVTGEVSQEQGLAIIQQAECVMMPSLWEGLPIALLEVMSLGIPVVATPVGGIPEVIVDGENGFLRQTPEAFAECAKQLHYDRALASQVAAQAMQTVEKQFQLESMAKRYHILY